MTTTFKPNLAPTKRTELFPTLPPIGNYTHIGGRWWRHSCGQTVKADCECCEPPKCGCEAR